MVLLLVRSLYGKVIFLVNRGTQPSRWPHLRTFPLHQKEPFVLLCSISPAHCPSWAPLPLCSGFLHWPVLDVACKRIPTACGLLCLAFLARHLAFKGSTLWQVAGAAFLFMAKSHFSAGINHRFPIHLSDDGHWDYIRFLAVMNKASVNICRQVFVWMLVSDSLG